ncbi:inorganic diphosphatase [Candidatus Jidaibacter acanthamoebae]|uniref:inorganic diphosphatase n=1 Tax=Candidatus Jidaibacter acanthamoebae TaxID=86105 RepID=UPI00057D3266|nr:inorganic diphosphatase [Candidatus Jidaibacter acanthamoeba]
MNLEKIKVGNHPPDDIHVVIEVPMNSDPVKYEYDKEVGAIFVDRFMPTSMFYPCNYGFIPNTLSGDGDPADVLVISSYPVVPGSVINAKPIGVLITEDEKGKDEKILAVPSPKVDLAYANINSYKDLPEIIIQKISHFFENYKSLEKGKWVKVTGWEDVDIAKKIINEAIKRFHETEE